MLVKWCNLDPIEINSMGSIVDEFRTLGWVVERVASCSHGGPQTMGAYLIVHLKTGMAYVGSHANLYSRPYQHHFLLNSRRHWCKKFQDAFDDDDRLLPMLLPTKECRDAAFAAEQHILDKFHSSGKLFNLSSDARAAARGMEVSEETRAKLSAAGLGRKQSPEWIAKRTSAKKGVPLAYQTREKIRAAAIARGAVISEKMQAAANEANCKKVYIDGAVHKSITAAASAHGITGCSVAKRLRSSWFPTWHYYSDIFERKVTADGVLHDSVYACSLTHDITVETVIKRLADKNDFFPTWKYFDKDAS